MNILIAIHALRLGGAEIFSVRLANFLSKDHQVYLYIHNEELSDSRLRSLVAPTVNLVFFHNNSVMNFILWKVNRLLTITSFAFREKLKKVWVAHFLKKRKIQVINSHCISTDLFFNSLNIQLPIVSTLHENRFQVDNDLMKNDLIDTIKGISCFIYLDERAVRTLEVDFNVSQDRLFKVYNGFDAPYRTLKQNGDCFVFGMIARGIREKGWHELIAAYRLLTRRIKKRTLLILVGGKSYFDELRPLTVDLSIEFIDDIINPIDVIMRINVGILPSYSENLPNFIVECLSISKPVISTDVGQARQMLSVQENPAGIIVPLVDERPSAEFLCEAMESILNDTELYRSLCFNTRKAFEKFDMRKCADNYIDIFRAATQSGV